LEGKWNNSYANLTTERELTHLTRICYTTHFNDLYHMPIRQLLPTPEFLIAQSRLTSNDI